ncbi:MAG: outer membrane lipoprotein-sorting protein [Chitinivibrionales bacterium]|nr:outer membrane lipoprotein-sorting protein [Chitinivibrionales bacterium]
MQTLRIVAAALVIAGTTHATAAVSTLSGADIMKKVYYREVGSDMQARLQMTLVNSRGDTRVRVIRQYLKYGDDVDKKLMVFEEPADVRNTAFMNWSYDEEGGDDDQWIYLPALKRVKRIPSGSRSDYFMGSDFTYDDLGDRHPSEDTHKLLRREKVDGEDCLVVESVPKEDGSMYSRTVTWVIDGKWIGLKKEFYDQDGKHLKTLQVKKIEQVDGYWTILGTRMHNVQKDHTTRMQLSDVAYDSGLSDALFTERTMQRGVR